jgi:hypothetical protein
MTKISVDTPDKFVIVKNELVDSGLADAMNKASSEALRIRHQYIEMLAAAFIKANPGLNPSECELVEVYNHGEIRWFFRKREEHEERPNYDPTENESAG